MLQFSLRLLLVPALLLAALVGCATPGPALVGADGAMVQAKVGSPAETFPLPGGGVRWMYPLGGLQQFVWTVDFDAAGRVTEVRQVRTAASFARVRVGVDTQADIRREFGTPRIVMPFSRVGLVGWMYPYLENDFWRSEMVIYFDATGIVRRIENGPDPRFLGGDDRR